MVVALLFPETKLPAALTMSLSSIAKSHSLRCDAKQGEGRFADFDKFINSVQFFYLGDVLPGAIVKGEQPRYLENARARGRACHKYPCHPADVDQR